MPEGARILVINVLTSEEFQPLPGNPTAAEEPVPSSAEVQHFHLEVLKHITAMGSRRYLKYREAENCSKEEQHQK